MGRIEARLEHIEGGLNPLLGSLLGQSVGAQISIGPLAQDVRSRIAPGALLVGDAGGFLNPFTGQGMFLALRGAECAASAIATVLAAVKRWGFAMLD